MSDYYERETASMPAAPKKTKRQRIAELETRLEASRSFEADLKREAKKQRLIVLLDKPGEPLTTVLDKRADDYVIESTNDYAPSYPDPVILGGTITIRWH